MPESDAGYLSCLGGDNRSPTTSPGSGS